jgi:uncharacterized protein YecT (DUF1311 family)
MNLRTFIFSLAIVCLTAGRAPANAPDPNAPIGSTPRLLADIAAGRKAAEKRLAAALQRAIRAIEKNDRISPGRPEMIIRDLKASQAAWEEFREKQCAFLYAYYFEEIGSLGARAAGIWTYEERIIDARIQELNEPPNYF